VLLKEKKGQVTVEFILMFIISASFLIYITFFSFTLTNLQYKEYIAFMMGRVVSASAQSYSTKKDNALELKNLYESTSSASMTVTTPLECSLYTNNGFRKILNYGADIAYDVVSITGIACSTKLNNILPSMRPVSVAMEMMTGSQISDKHCECSLKFSNAGYWKTCLNEASSGNTEKGLIDNGC
jgi:uncharacterized protein (UPF0333 family)